MSHQTPSEPISILETARLLRRGVLSPLQLVELHLARIEKHNPTVNAFWAVYGEEARREAARAGEEIAAGNWRGPLHGVPVGVKDLFDLAGRPNPGGSKILAGSLAEKDANAVARLKQAGAIVLGRTAMHEFAFGITSRNPHYGPTRNPWDASRMCGGSSAGSGAAVAAGLAPLALGTDTGGSIRIPSSLCGICGLKPSFGLVGKSGVLPLSFAMDHVGPMALFVEDLALALDALAGPDPGDPFCDGEAGGDYLEQCLTGEDLAGVTVGRPVNFFFDGLDPEVARAVEEFFAHLAELGARVIPVEVPLAVPADRAALAVLFSEASHVLKPYADERPEDLDPEVLHNVLVGQSIPAHRYIQALRIRRDLSEQMRDKVFNQVDVLATPATPLAAPPLQAESVNLGGETVLIRPAITRFMRFFNLSGLPVLALPIGLNSEGLPMGIQIAAKPFAEGKLLSLGRVVQRAFPLRPLLAPLA